MVSRSGNEMEVPPLLARPDENPPDPNPPPPLLARQPIEFDPNAAEPVQQPFDPNNAVPESLVLAQQARQQLAEIQAGKHPDTSHEDVTKLEVAAGMDKPQLKRFWEGAKDIPGGISKIYQDWKNAPPTPPPTQEQIDLQKKDQEELSYITDPDEYERARMYQYMQRASDKQAGSFGIVGMVKAVPEAVASLVPQAVNVGVALEHLPVTPQGAADTFFSYLPATHPWMMNQQAHERAFADQFQGKVEQASDQLADNIGLDRTSAEAWVTNNVVPMLIPMGEAGAAGKGISSVVNSAMQAGVKAGALRDIALATAAPYAEGSAKVAAKFAAVDMVAQKLGIPHGMSEWIASLIGLGGLRKGIAFKNAPITDTVLSGLLTQQLKSFWKTERCFWMRHGGRPRTIPLSTQPIRGR